jgi:hypothetical protein|tara:strand:+ start:1926 stop:2420 length:495 start_codon:yes stop_codon:yes gene_type:complete
MFASAMARKRGRGKAKRTSRKKQPLNLFTAAELYLQTNVLTQNVMGTNPWTALTGRESYQSYQPLSPGSSKGGNVGMIGYNPSGATVTVPELLGLDSASGTVVPFGQGVEVIKTNFKANLVPIVLQTVGVRIGFSIAKSLLSKQRNFINSKVLKPIGIERMVRV